MTAPPPDPEAPASPSTWLRVRERLIRVIARSRLAGWLILTVANRVDRLLMRVTGGRASVALGLPVLLLTTTGARTGRRRSTPLVYVTEGDTLAVIASRVGTDRNPGWYHNLRAHPAVDVLAPRRSGRYTARVAEGEERERLWRRAVAVYPGYEDYRARARTRQIPVVVLTRSSG